jgi:hypothetical protein
LVIPENLSRARGHTIPLSQILHSPSGPAYEI